MEDYLIKVNDALKGLKSNMTDQQFFSSEWFYRYLTNYIKNLTIASTASKDGKERGKRIHVVCMCDERSDKTAYTNNYTITTNTLGPIVRKIKGRQNRYYGNIAKVCHEIWHILFTDFVASGEHFQRYVCGEFKWASDKPTSSNADEVATYLNAHNNFRKLFFEQMKNLDNVFEDVYVNKRGTAMMPGIPAYGLRILYDAMYKNVVLEDMVKKNNVIALLQAEGLGYTLPSNGEIESIPELKAKYTVICNVTDSCKPFTEQLAIETNGRKRALLVDEIMCILFAYYKKNDEQDPPQQQSGNGEGKESNSDDNNQSESNDSSDSSSDDDDNSDDSQSDSGNSDASEEQSDDTEDEGDSSQGTTQQDSSQEDNDGDLTDDELNDLLNQLLNSEANTAAPEGNTEPINEQYTEEEQKKSEEAEKGAKSQETADTESKVFDGIENEIMEDCAKESVEQSRSSDMQKEARELEKELLDKYQSNADDEKEAQKNQGMNGIGDALRNDMNAIDNLHDYPFRIARQTGITDSMIRKYDSEYYSIKSVVDSTVRLLKKILNDKDKQQTSSGYRMGRFDQKAVARSAYYNDGKIFRRKHDPLNPKITFGLLIDESGSMFGEKEYNAQITAIALEAILRELNIPNIICGHYSSEACSIKLYHDFEDVDGNDKYRLTTSGSQSCNADSIAISYIAEKLLKRPEEKKVLIVISDGIPTCVTVKDTQVAVESYRQKGVEVFGAVIDGDYQRIQTIYGDRTMDCTDYNTLPNKLCGLVKRFISK